MRAVTGEPEPELRALFDRIHSLHNVNMRDTGVIGTRDAVVWDLLMYLCPDNCTAALAGVKKPKPFDERVTRVNRPGSWLHGRLFKHLWLMDQEEKQVNMSRYPTPSARWRIPWKYATFKDILKKKKGKSQSHSHLQICEIGSEIGMSDIRSPVCYMSNF
jgi:hypothetical protein